MLRDATQHRFKKNIVPAWPADRAPCEPIPDPSLQESKVQSYPFSVLNHYQTNSHIRPSFNHDDLKLLCCIQAHRKIENNNSGLHH